MAREISNYADIIDSRDIIERIEELSDTDTEDLTDDELAELAALKALADEAAKYADDWRYGVTLIRDSYFMTYAQELADEIGAVDSDAKWPMTHIDWHAAARDLRMDYTSVRFGDTDYWVR